MIRLYIVLFLVTGVSTEIMSRNSLPVISGRLIFNSAEMIEVKKGKREYVFYLTEGTKVVKDNSDGTVADLAVCQVVSVTYTTTGDKHTAVQVVIIKDSNCTR